MATEQFLLALEAGLGHGETAIFPVGIYRVKEGINYNPEDPNYDLFKLAIRVSAKRLFPNFCFLDAPFNLQYYKPGHPETEVGYMGAVTENACISIRLDYSKIHWGITFREAYKRFHDWPGTVEIRDRGEWVQVTMWHNYPDGEDWYDVTFNDGEIIRMTSDHPLPTQRGRVLCEDLQVGDTVPVSGYKSKEDTVSIIAIKFVGATGQRRYDVTTASDRFDVNGINSHNCRTRVMGNVYDPTREIAYSRGNLSFTTINLPRLAIESHGDVAVFFDKLQDILEATMKQLLDRFEVQASRKARNFPFLMGQHVWLDSDKLKPDDEVREVLKHGTLSIGFVGLAECLKALIGKHHGESEEAQQLGLEIIGYIRKFCDLKSQQLKMNVTCLASPAESTAGRLLRLDKVRYGIIPGVTDRAYYTNSFHIPVYFNISAAKKIKLEAPYHALTNAGHISYVEMDGDPLNNLEAFERIVRYMKECGIGYGSINHPVDRDPVCGYTGIIRDECPHCRRTESVLKHERIPRLCAKQ